LRNKIPALSGDFFLGGFVVFYRGILEKVGVSTWYLGGGNVVEVCMNVVSCCMIFSG
jgi:hypothetical protein